MPNIQRLYAEYGEKVAFVLASQEDPETVRKFMEQHGYSLPSYRIIQNLPEKLQSPSIPTTFLIGPDGKILVKKTGAARWDGNFFTSYLDELLKE
jgi:hypothetical protein